MRRKKRKKGGSARSTNGLRKAIDAGLVYEGNPKHKEPWQSGRKGSLCPKEIRIEQAQILLNKSILQGKKRYGVDGQGRAYCAQAHDEAHSRWHGYPVGWREGPVEAQKQFMNIGIVSNHTLNRTWKSNHHNEQNS